MTAGFIVLFSFAALANNGNGQRSEASERLRPQIRESMKEKKE